MSPPLQLLLQWSCSDNEKVPPGQPSFMLQPSISRNIVNSANVCESRLKGESNKRKKKMKGQRETGWRQKIAKVEESRCSATMEKRRKHTHLCDPICRRGRLCTLQYSTCISVKSQPIRLYRQWDETPCQTACLSDTCLTSPANKTPVYASLRLYFRQHYLVAFFFLFFLSRLFYSLICSGAFTKVV